MQFPPLTERWEQADWSPSFWTARLRNFVNPADDILITLELLSNGSCEWTVNGKNGKQVGQDIAESKEAAAHWSLYCLRAHFRSKRKQPYYVLEYLPWKTDRQIKEALDTVQSTANCWRRGEGKGMSSRSITMACRHMGIWGYARGAGELCKLITPYWETPEYAMSPINVDEKRTGRCGRKPGAAWYSAKQPKKAVDNGGEV